MRWIGRLAYGVSAAILVGVLWSTAFPVSPDAEIILDSILTFILAAAIVYAWGKI